MGLTEGGYTGSVRVLFMADGWVLADEHADTNAVNLLEWESLIASDDVDPGTLQEATDDVEWTFFCVPFLPTPTSAHAALAQQGVAERLVATTFAIHQANGLPKLELLDWTVTFPR
jgi:hypothetical protein